MHDAWEVELPNRMPTSRLLTRIEEGLASRPAPVSPWWQFAAAAAFVVVAVSGPALIPLPQVPAEVVPPVAAVAKDVSKTPRSRAAWLQSETSEHLGQTQLLLRSIRNSEDGVVPDLAYERELSRELLSRNRLLRRQAEQKEFVRAEELLSQIEPILLDIANLPEQPAADEVRSVKDLIRSQKIIAELQLYSGKSLF
jgi:hypothetical protein